MEVNGYCKNCGQDFNAHWHKGVDIMNPKCPVCKSPEVHTWTDEALEYETTNVDLGDEDE